MNEYQTFPGPGKALYQVEYSPVHRMVLVQYRPVVGQRELVGVYAVDGMRLADTVFYYGVLQRELLEDINAWLEGLE